jgi:transcriptional/translational regulatory protein YebC/TACO1
VRTAFTKTKCKIGTQGSVAHMFEHLAVFTYKGEDEDAALEALMDADVDVSDIESEDGELTAFCAPTDFLKTKTALTALGVTEFEVEEIQWIPTAYTQLSDDDMELFEKFIGILEDLDDVQNIYHNVEL